jgi:hypothetical protein
MDNLQVKEGQLGTVVDIKVNHCLHGTVRQTYCFNLYIKNYQAIWQESLPKEFGIKRIVSDNLRSSGRREKRIGVFD